MNSVLFLLLYSVFNECIEKSNQLKTSYTSYKTVKNQLKKQLYQLGLYKNPYINITGLT